MASVLSVPVPASIPVLPVLVFSLFSIFASLVPRASRSLRLRLLSLSSPVLILEGRASIPSRIPLVPVGPGHQLEHLSSLLQLLQGDPHPRETGVDLAL